MRRFAIPESRTLEPSAADALDASVAAKKAARKLKKPKGIGPSRLAKLGNEAAEAFRAGDCSQLRSTHFVGVYCWLHEKVYGVAVFDELKGEAVKFCAGMAKRMLDKEFGGNVESMADFFRWTWSRERIREGRRRADGLYGSRITWRVMFGGKFLLNDYRVYLNRSGGS